MAYISAMLHEPDGQTKSWSSTSREPGRVEMARAGLTAIFGVINSPRMNEETAEAVWDQIDEIRKLVGP